MTEAERERLAMLAEEAGEIVQMVGKILRHGYDSYHPNDEKKTPNCWLLQDELNDLAAVVYGMQEAGDISVMTMDESRRESDWQKKLKWTYHQPGYNVSE